MTPDALRKLEPTFRAMRLAAQAAATAERIAAVRRIAEEARRGDRVGHPLSPCEAERLRGLLATAPRLSPPDPIAIVPPPGLLAVLDEGRRRADRERAAAPRYRGLASFDPSALDRTLAELTARTGEPS